MKKASFFAQKIVKVIIFITSAPLHSDLCPRFKTEAKKRNSKSMKQLSLTAALPDGIFPNKNPNLGKL
jgi:hypothetical protein